MASITSGGSTGRHIFLATKRDDAISTAPTAHRDPCLIDELHGATRWIQLNPKIQPLLNSRWPASVSKPSARPIPDAVARSQFR